MRINIKTTILALAICLLSNTAITTNSHAFVNNQDVPYDYDFKVLSKYTMGKFIWWWNFDRIKLFWKALPKDIQQKSIGYPQVNVYTPYSHTTNTIIGPTAFYYKDPIVHSIKLKGNPFNKPHITDKYRFEYLKYLDNILADFWPFTLPKPGTMINLPKVPEYFPFKALSAYKNGTYVAFWTYSRINYLYEKLDKNAQYKIKGAPQVIHKFNQLPGFEPVHHNEAVVGSLKKFPPGNMSTSYKDPFIGNIKITKGMKEAEKYKFEYLKKIDHILFEHYGTEMPPILKMAVRNMRDMELDLMHKKIKHSHSVFEQSRGYFNQLLQTNINRAQVTYLYLKKTLLEMERNLSKLEIFALNLPLYPTKREIAFQKEAEVVLVECSEMYMKDSVILENYRNDLEKKVASIEKLEQKIDEIRIDIPFINVVNGNYDSDADGKPDENQFDSPPNPNIAHKVITLTMGGGDTYNFDSGSYTSSMSGMAINLGMYGNVGNQFIALHGGDVLELPDLYTPVPETGYWGNLFFYALVPGQVCSMKYGNKYVKIHILSSVRNRSVTFEYWYKKDGGVF